MGHDFDLECVEFVDMKIHGMMIIIKEIEYVDRMMQSSYWMVGMKNGEAIICTDLVFKIKNRRSK